MMSSFYFLRDEIHLSVNKFSSGTWDHYSKVISIFPIRQGKEKDDGNSEKVYFYGAMNFDWRFLIHGWGESSSFFSVETTDAFLQHSDFNVIRFAKVFSAIEYSQISSLYNLKRWLVSWIENFKLFSRKKSSNTGREACWGVHRLSWRTKSDKI